MRDGQSLPAEIAIFSGVAGDHEFLSCCGWPRWSWIFSQIRYSSSRLASKRAFNFLLPSFIIKAIHSDLLEAYERVYLPCEYASTLLLKEPESKEYGADTFEVNHLKVRFRVAQVTPKKVGQFVTLWRRMGTGPIQPFHEADLVDRFVVSVRKGESLRHLFFRSLFWSYKASFRQIRERVNELYVFIPPGIEQTTVKRRRPSHGNWNSSWKSDWSGE